MRMARVVCLSKHASPILLILIPPTDNASLISNKHKDKSAHTSALLVSMPLSFGSLPSHGFMARLKGVTEAKLSKNKHRSKVKGCEFSWRSLIVTISLPAARTRIRKTPCCM